MQKLPCLPTILETSRPDATCMFDVAFLRMQDVPNAKAGLFLITLRLNGLFFLPVTRTWSGLDPPACRKLLTSNCSSLLLLDACRKLWVPDLRLPHLLRAMVRNRLSRLYVL